MSWSELERLVESAEADNALRRALSHCRSEPELVLAARTLGYRITSRDLARARIADRQGQPMRQEPLAGQALEHCGGAGLPLG